MVGRNKPKLELKKKVKLICDPIGFIWFDISQEILSKAQFSK